MYPFSAALMGPGMLGLTINNQATNLAPFQPYTPSFTILNKPSYTVSYYIL